MPAPPATPTGVIRFSHRVAGQSFRSEFGYTGGPATTANLVSLAGSARAQYSSHFAALVATGNAMNLTIASDLSQPSLPVGQDTTSVNGSHASSAAPASCAVLIHFNPDRKYRGSKPKAWLPFGTDADLQDAVNWSSSFITSVNSAWAAYATAIAALTAGTVSMSTQVGVSYFGPPTRVNTGPGRNKTESTPRTTPLVMQITSVGARQMFGSQRRRLLV
jgi:hypothetical protein